MKLIDIPEVVRPKYSGRKRLRVGVVVYFRNVAFAAGELGDSRISAAVRHGMTNKNNIFCHLFCYRKIP
jgi:hypothetical protein